MFCTEQCRLSSSIYCSFERLSAENHNLELKFRFRPQLLAKNLAIIIINLIFSFIPHLGHVHSEAYKLDGIQNFSLYTEQLCGATIHYTRNRISVGLHDIATTVFCSVLLSFSGKNQGTTLKQANNAIQNS
jgi:hypothetical protein